jgi:ribonuclease P protein component
VVRNRLRRRLREAARSLAPQIQGGADVVLTPLAGAPDASYRALREGVQAGLAAARILRGDDR